MRIFDATLGTLERALDARLERQTLLTGNLANADTPGFVPRDLDVAARIAAPPELPPSAGPAAALPGPPPPAPLPGAGIVSAAAPGPDGNAVDVDRTLVALAENALQYHAAARAAGKKLAILRYVASDGVA